MKKRVMMTTSSSNDIYVVNKAHEMGYELIIANSYTEEQAKIKKSADESYQIDASNTDAIVDFVKTHRIDGIFVTGSDAHLRFYCDICEKTGLVSYCSKSQVDIISEKINFKKKCCEYGLNVIQEYTVNDDEKLEKGKIHYPVIVKSPDNSGGSKGMTLVMSEEELIPAIKYAKSFSPTRSYVVEHYIDGDEFVINYFFVDGEPFVLYTKDYCKNTVNGMVMRDNAMISPSKYEKLFYEKADKKLRMLLKDIGMKNGIIFLQCFVENDELYFFEGGCRAGGADEYVLWQNIYGIDFIKCMLSFAATGNYGIADIKKMLSGSKQKKKESVLNVLVRSGTISEIRGVEKIREIPEVSLVTVMRDVGDVIANDYTSGQIAVRVMIEADDNADYLSTIDRIYNTLSVLDEKKEEMIIPHIDFSHWLNQ